MSEHLAESNSNTQPKTAREVEWIQSSASLLSAKARRLAAIDSQVPSDIIVDTRDIDFGRIPDVEKSRELAALQDKKRTELIGQSVPDKKATEYSKTDLDIELSENLHKKVVRDTVVSIGLPDDRASRDEIFGVATEIASKVVTDYQMTQGNPEALARRKSIVVAEAARENFGGNRRQAIEAINAIDAANQAYQEEDKISS